MKRAFVRVSEKVAVRILTLISEALKRILLILSLILAVACTILFIYGLATHSLFYSAFSIIGAPVFVYINKQC